MGWPANLTFERPILIGSPETMVSNDLSVRNVLITIERLARRIALSIRTSTGQLIASLTGLPTRLSISTSVSMVNLAAFLFTTSDTRGRETIKISAASACFK